VKKRLLDLLVCPGCHGALTLLADRDDGEEIVTGALVCAACARRYPIARGVPRFVASPSYAASFGFQWKTFRAVQLDSANGSRESEASFAAKTGLTPATVKDRVVLDAGVGAGRFAEVVSRWGGEVVGVDLTDAVDAAFDNVGRHRLVHIVQADIFALPFPPRTFDIAYSIGVLHHTPEPERAFECVSAVVRPGGVTAVYVYAALGVARHFSDALRKVTTRLPKRVVLWLAAAAVPLFYLYRLPVLGRVCQIVCPISMHPRWRWRWLDTFDWYTPTFQLKFSHVDVYRWFRSRGYVDIDLFDVPICIRGVKQHGG